MLRIKIKIFFVSFLVIILLGCAGAIREQQMEKALTLDKQHFKSKTICKDDSLDTIAKFSTVNGIQEKRGLLGIVWDDNFLRAFVDKKTGATKYQVYNIVWYKGKNWQFYYRANYETPDGPKTCKLTEIHRDVDCSGSMYEGCKYTEHVGFLVEEQVLRTIAEKYESNWQPGLKAAWKYKLVSKGGSDYPDGILPAEVAGLLERVDEYKKAKKF